MNVKNDLANKRGVCPKCHGKFRIPSQSQELSLRIDPIDLASSTPPRDPIDHLVTNEPVIGASQSPTPTTGQTENGVGNAPTLETKNLFFVRPPSGGEYGPAARETIETWIGQRRVTAETLVCQVGTTDWKKAREVFANLFVLDLSDR